MSNQSFTLVLPSNSNPHIFPDNSPSKYSVVFQNPIQLLGKHEVALTEVIYKNEIDLLKDNFIEIYKERNHDPVFQLVGNDSDLVWQFKVTNLRPFDYDEAQFQEFTIEDILDIFQPIDAIASMSVITKMGIHRASLSFKLKDVVVVLNEDLSNLFGFPYQTFSKRYQDDSIKIELKKRVTNWSAYIVPLYALKSRKVILKKKGEEGLAPQALVKRWETDFPMNKLLLKTEVADEKGLTAKIVKKASLQDGKWCVFEFNEDFQKWLNIDQPYLAQKNETRLVKSSYNSARAKEHTDKEWSVTVYSNVIVESETIKQNTKRVLVDKIRLNEVSITGVDVLVKTLNEKSYEYLYKFDFCTTTKRMKVFIPPKYDIVLDSVLQAMLGFPKENILKSGITVASSPPQLTRNIRNVYVYCNIIDYIHVGDIEAPLLRTFPLSPKTSEIVNREFIHRMYIPMNRNLVDRIDISLHDDGGELIPFRGGITILTLEIRPLTQRL